MSEILSRGTWKPMASLRLANGVMTSIRRARPKRLWIGEPRPVARLTPIDLEARAQHEPLHDLQPNE